jgi:DNA topoisomerase VI subunit B
MAAPLDRNKIRDDFAAAVNMSAEEIEDWLDTDESRSVGQTKPGASESVGRQSARRIITILRTPEPELDEEDYRHMRKVVGFVKRHRAQEPANMVSSRWRYSLMNWGRDPLQD